MDKPFRYTMTDCNRESLIKRIEDASKRGFHPISEINSSGHRPMTYLAGKKRIKTIHTEMKFYVLMERKEVV